MPVLAFNFLPTNQDGQLTAIIPFRPGSKQAAYAVNVRASKTNGLNQNRFLEVGQVRALDGCSIRECQGTIENQYWQPIQAALNIVLGFE